MRTFMSPAFIREVERGTFGLFRSIEVEEKDERTGKVTREKLRDVGPIGLFRECVGGEREDLTSFHPVEKRPMRLRKVS